MIVAVFVQLGKERSIVEAAQGGIRHALLFLVLLNHFGLEGHPGTVHTSIS
jgi:hypothetical protein